MDATEVTKHQAGENCYLVPTVCFICDETAVFTNFFTVFGRYQRGAAGRLVDL